MEKNLKKQVENLAEKFSKFPKETNYNNKRSNNYFGNKIKRTDTNTSQNSTLRDSITQTVKLVRPSITKTESISCNHQKRSSSKIFYIINNNQLQSKFEICFDSLSTKKTLYKLPAKEINSDDSFEEMDDNFSVDIDDEIGIENEIKDRSDKNFEILLNIIEFYENFMKNFENFAIFLSKSKENFTLIENWLDNKHIIIIAENPILQNVVRELNKLEIIEFGLIITIYVLIKSNHCIESELYTNIYNILKNCLFLICKNFMYLIPVLTQGKTKIPDELKLVYDRKISKTKFLDGSQNKETIEDTNKIIISKLLLAINQLSEYYIARDTKYHDVDFDLKNLEYMFYSLKNIKTANYEDIKDTIYNDVLIRNLLKINVVDVNNEEADESYIAENDTEDSNTLPPVPFLPPINNKYSYTLVVDLDETLVHYMEEENEAYVQVRPFAEFFLNEMSKYFEIVIFTAATEEYADIVLGELDSNRVISHKLYRRHTMSINNHFIKDLGKLGRNLKKTIIIDNVKENFLLQPNNGLNISNFMGDEKDTELLNLANELKDLANKNLDDLRMDLENIRIEMKKRYNVNI